MLVRTPTIGGQKRLITPFGSGAPKVHRAPSGGGGSLTDTFNMSVRHDFWPALNTAEVGTWTWSGSASKMFGGQYTNSSQAQNDYIEFANVPLQAGDYEIRILATKSAASGIVSVYHDSSDTGADLDLYNASTTHNNVVTDTFTIGSKTRGTLRLIVETKNASSSAYEMGIQQIEIVKTSADSDAGSSLDDLPWVMDVPPISYSATTGPGTVAQNTSNTWGSQVYATSAQNEYIEFKVWLAEGTYDLNMVCSTFTSRAILDVTINGGSSVGTMDTYSASPVFNVTKTISGISISFTGVHTVRLTAATKNASSSNYYSYINWLQFRKTTETGAIVATGATYGQESAEFWPWFADTKVGYGVFGISSSSIHYGYYYQAAPAQNNSLAWAHGLLPGTYSGVDVAATFNNYGTAHYRESGVTDLDTVNYFSASLLFNQRLPLDVALSLSSLTAILASTTTAGYQTSVNFIRLTRTGA